jgi:hypothetical protein
MRVMIIALGCLAFAAQAGERSPGEDLRSEVGPGDGRETQEQGRDWRYSRPPRSRPDDAPSHDLPAFPPSRYVDPWTAYERCMRRYDDPLHCERYVPGRFGGS